MSRGILVLVALLISPTVDATCNHADARIWQTINATYPWTNSRCAKNCQDRPSCVTTCVQASLGLSSGCAASLGDLALCTRNACSGQRKRCTLCKCSIDANCISDFATSTGLSLVDTPFGDATLGN
jgi:hypothetical protein